MIDVFSYVGIIFQNFQLVAVEFLGFNHIFWQFKSNNQSKSRMKFRQKSFIKADSWTLFLFSNDDINILPKQNKSLPCLTTKSKQNIKSHISVSAHWSNSLQKLFSISPRHYLISESGLKLLWWTSGQFQVMTRQLFVSL